MDLELQDYRCQKVEELEKIVGFMSFPFSHDMSLEFRLLNYVDPYGKTVFNHLQMDDLLHDLTLVKENYKDVPDLEFLERAGEMAMKCKEGRGNLYLTFFGD